MEVGLRPEERRIFIVVKAQLYNPTSMPPGGILDGIPISACEDEIMKSGRIRLSSSSGL